MGGRTTDRSNVDEVLNSATYAYSKNLASMIRSRFFQPARTEFGGSVNSVDLADCLELHVSLRFAIPKLRNFRT